MKKVVLLLLIAISFSGCENNDDDSIIGFWKIRSTKVGDVEDSNLSECDLLQEFDFYGGNHDNDFRAGYIVTPEGHICDFLFPADKWQKSSNGVYHITDLSGNIISEVVKVNKNTIMFQNIQGHAANYKKILVRK